MNINLEGSDYMKLLLTQLKNQNPMDPLDNSEMLGQVSDLANLEASTKLQSSFDDVLQIMNLTGGAGLVGKTVEYGDDEGAARATVDAVKVDDGRIKLECGDTVIELSEIKSLL